jgi:hypothetical protein
MLIPPSGGALNPNLISETDSSVIIRVFHEYLVLGDLDLFPRTPFPPPERTPIYRKSLYDMAIYIDIKYWTSITSIR